MIKGFHHVAISVSDLNKSIEFYNKFFGFEIAQSFTRKDLNGEAVFLKFRNVIIELWEFRDSVDSRDDKSNLKIIGLRHLAFDVENIDKIYDELSDKIEITKPRMGASGRRYCFVSDPDGVQIELYESVEPN